MWPGLGREKARLASKNKPLCHSIFTRPPRLINTSMCQRTHNDLDVRTEHPGRGKAPPLKGASPSSTPSPLLTPGCFHRGPRAEVQTLHYAEILAISTKLFWTIVRLPTATTESVSWLRKRKGTAQLTQKGSISAIPCPLRSSCKLPPITTQTQESTKISWRNSALREREGTAPQRSQPFRHSFSTPPSRMLEPRTMCTSVPCRLLAPNSSRVS